MQNAIQKAAEAMTEQMDRELHGAWRAGYDYLHVYDELPEPLGSEGLTDQFSLSMYVLPTDSERPPRPDELQYRHTYDIASADDREIRAAIKQGGS